MESTPPSTGHWLESLAKSTGSAAASTLQPKQTAGSCMSVAHTARFPEEGARGGQSSADMDWGPPATQKTEDNIYDHCPWLRMLNSSRAILNKVCRCSFAWRDVTAGRKTRRKRTRGRPAGEMSNGTQAIGVHSAESGLFGQQRLWPEPIHFGKDLSVGRHTPDGKWADSCLWWRIAERDTNRLAERRPAPLIHF